MIVRYPYDEDYSEKDDSFFDFRGDLIDRQPKQLDDINIYELRVYQ